MKVKMSFSRSLMAAAITASFAAGYLASGGTAKDRKRGESSGHLLRLDIPGKGDNRASRGAIAGKPWEDSKERLMKLWEASPALRVDFELRDETRRLLERVSDSDLESWLRELRSDDEYEDSDRDIQRQMHDMVLTVLAPRGADALIRSLAERPTERGEEDLMEAMDLWTRHDPAAVLAWLEGPVPDAIKVDLEDYREDALDELELKKTADLED
jgi:hypothetical protein